MRTLLLVLACLLPLAGALAQPGQPPPPDQHERMQAMVAARNLAMAVAIYGSSNQTLPPDVRAMADGGILSADMGEVGQDASTWMAGGVAYRYLGVAGVSAGEVPDWGDLAIAHRSLEHAFVSEPTDDNPEGASVPVAFLDGHVEMVSRAEARWLIDDATRTFAALRDGAGLPVYRQVEQDARRLAHAMIAHAAANDGLAPPDWAATFGHLPENPRQEGETPAQRLRLYLSPRSRDTTFIPEFDAGPQGRAERDAWINTHSMWRSDAMGVNLWHVPNPIYTVLLHARPDAWVEYPDRRQRAHVRRLAYATADGRGDTAEPEPLEARARDARELYEAIGAGGPLPPLDDAMHDLRVLSNAIADYARANDGFLPPDLGEVMPYVQGLWGVHEREPARLFLIRANETPENATEIPDAAWIREHCSYAYLGDARVRLRDLRGSNATMLLHAPIDRPFDFVAFGDVRPRVPTIGPPLGVPGGPGDHFARSPFAFPPEFVAEQAEAARRAMLEIAEK